MELIFDGEVFVHYGFIFLNAADDETPDLDDSRAGQRNGLLGSAVPGALAMMAATHTGRVSFRVEWSDSEPAPDPAWDEVVESTYTISDPALLLSTFDDFHEVSAPATGSHRARLNAAGMDAASEQDSPDNDELAVDRYLLQLWPAPPARDVIVRQTSQTAAYWHGEAQRTSPLDAEEIADHARKRMQPAPVIAWTPPSSAQDGFAVVNDLPLSAKVQAPAWLARRACEAAGIAYLPWVRSALDALRQRQPLPSDYPDSREAAAALVLPALSDPLRVRQALDTVFLAASADPTGDLSDVVTAAHATLAADGEDVVDELLRHLGMNH